MGMGMGMDIDVYDEKIFDFIFIEAMGDATLRGAYNGDKRKLKECSTLSELKDGLCKFVENVLNGSFLNQDHYNEEFLELAKTVCRKIAKITGDSEFTFGNAQKLINMTLKYFFISTYGQSEEERAKFQFCHCPMDGMMTDVVWKEKQNSERNDRLREIITCNYNEFHDGWGKLEFKNGCYPKRYKEFQCAVRYLSKKDKIFPIEYDFCKWNESKISLSDTGLGNVSGSK